MGLSQHQLEKAQLELKLCQAEKEKAEIEARYLREKYEGEKPWMNQAILSNALMIG